MRRANALPDSVVGRISGGSASRAAAGSSSNHRPGGSSTWLSAEIRGRVRTSMALLASSILVRAKDIIKPMRWRERSLDRALERERRKSEEHTRAFVAAAHALALETGGLDFTVQQVVERAHGSLRGFYRNFAGKEELCL